MDLLFKHDIDDNVFSTTITVDALGTEQLSEDEEKEMLHDFPTKLAYRNCTFTKNITINGTVPEVTDSDADDQTIVSVTLPTLSNKEPIVDETFCVTYKISTSKIPASALNDVLTTKELVAQAYCLVFDAVILDKVTEILTAVRAKAPSFTGETIESV